MVPPRARRDQQLPHSPLGLQRPQGKAALPHSPTGLYFFSGDISKGFHACQGRCPGLEAPRSEPGCVSPRAAAFQEKHRDGGVAARWLCS